MKLINGENISDSLDIQQSQKDSKNVEKRKKLITIGECSKFYLYILGAALFQFISIFILGGLENIGFFGIYPVLSTYRIIQSIYTYIGYIIFGIIYYFCFRGKKRTNEENDENILNFNENLLMYKSSNLYFQIFLVCFCYGLYLEIQNLLYNIGLEALNIWTFGTIFTFLLMKKYYPFDIYNHHKLSIIFISITSSIFIFISSFFPNSSSKDEEKLNTYQNVEKIFGSYYYSILIILLFIFVNFIFSYYVNFSKVLIQFKNMSLYKLIIFIGIFGLIISIIFSLIFGNIYYKYNILEYFLELKSSQNIFIEIFVIYPIFIFSKYMQMYFEILLIYYLNPVYVLIANNLTYGISKLISFLSNNCENFENFLFSELAEICAILGNIVYVEIIELNFCGLSDNIRRNIKSKGELDLQELFIIQKRTINTEDDEEENNKNIIEIYD